MSYTLNEAAKATGKSKTTIHRALKSGKISASKLNNGSYSIEASELHRVFPAVPAEHDMERFEHGRNDVPSIAFGTLQNQLANIEKEREREREQLQETIADLREDRDKWRQQATALLQDKRPKGLWARLMGR